MLGDDYRNPYLDAVLGSGTPTTVWAALSTQAFTPQGGGAEVSNSGTGYARKGVTNNSTNFPAASSTSNQKTNGTAITFNTATAAWGTITWMGIFSNSVGGSLIHAFQLTTPKPVDVGDGPVFNIGKFVVSAA